MYHLSQYRSLHHRKEGKTVQYQRSTDGTYEEYMESPIPKDARVVSVSPDGEKIGQRYDISAEIWIDVTSQEEIESQIMVRNKRHLQQTARERGVTTWLLVNEIQANHGLNTRGDDLLAGKFEREHDVSEEMAWWNQAVKQTDKEKDTPKVVGARSQYYSSDLVWGYTRIY